MTENKTITAKLGEIEAMGYRYATTSKTNGGYVFELATFDPPQPSETVFEVAAEEFDHAVNCAHEWALKNHSHSRNSKEYWEEVAKSDRYDSWLALKEKIRDGAELDAATIAWNRSSADSQVETQLANLIASYTFSAQSKRRAERPG